MSTAEERQEWARLAAINDTHTWGMRFRNEAIAALLADVDALSIELDHLRPEWEQMRQEREAALAELAQVRSLIAAVPTSNIILLTEAGVRPDDSWLIGQWAHEFFAMQLDMPEFISP